MTQTITIKSLIFVLLLSCPLLAISQDFEQLVQNLNARSYVAKGQAIEQLVATRDSRATLVLQSMLNGELYYAEGRKAVVLYKVTDTGSVAINAATGEELGEIPKRQLDKIRINNSLRGKLRTAVAAIQLNSKDRKTRLNAARDLIKGPDPALREVIVDALRSEQSAAIKNELEVALAIIDARSTDVTEQKDAIETLGRSVAPEAIAILQGFLLKDEAGKHVEANPEIVKAARKSLDRAESRIGLYGFIENLFFGLSLGSVLLLAAIGLAITFGVMGVINMAHGEMIMLGAYTTFAIQQIFPGWIDASIIIAIPAAFLVSGFAGVIIERTVIRHLYGRPLETLLATFGISLVLQQAVRSYNSNNVPVITPDWMSGFYQFNGALSFTYNRLYIIAFSLLVLGLLALVLRKTMLGLQMRAVTQNRAMANSMGIRSSWIDALTFGLGSGIAGIAGVALSQITNVGPNMGQGYIIDSFMVVVFGGVGNLLGTFFAAMGLGVFGKFLEPYSGAVLGKIIILVFIILFIQWRPRGLFALKGRFVED